MLDSLHSFCIGGSPAQPERGNCGHTFAHSPLQAAANVQTATDPFKIRTPCGGGLKRAVRPRPPARPTMRDVKRWHCNANQYVKLGGREGARCSVSRRRRALPYFARVRPPVRPSAVTARCPEAARTRTESGRVGLVGRREIEISFLSQIVENEESGDFQKGTQCRHT